MKELEKYTLFVWFLDYKYTSMGPSVEVFERFLKKLESTWHGKLQEESGELSETEGVTGWLSG